jgi:hypothetical protein
MATGIAGGTAAGDGATTMAIVTAIGATITAITTTIGAIATGSRVPRHR